MSKTDPREIPIIIPSYEPDEKLIKLLADLKEKGFSKIVIVDDGSGEEYQHFFEQAKEKMAPNTSPILEILAINTMRAPIIYTHAMNGTNFSVTWAILLIPPTITSPATIINIKPTINAYRFTDMEPSATVLSNAGIANTEVILLAMVLTWLMFPIPKDAVIQNTENNTARTLPIVLQPFLEPSPSRK